MARGRTSKATKKFEKNHLGKVIETRKIQKKNKEKYNKNKDRNDVRKSAAREIVQKEFARKKAIAAGKGDLFDDMTMDEFLATPAENMMQIDGTPQYTQETGEDGEEEVVGVKEAEELERAHMQGLEGLKEKDPSFYEFLKQNDRELLEFDPDELVEDEDDAEEEEAPVEGGLTKEILARWETLLVEEKSLSALKKVLIAVRNAAANVTGEDPQNGNTKYVLTDPEGTVSPRLFIVT
jgi:nucleolar complex protein 2